MDKKIFAAFTVICIVFCCYLYQTCYAEEYTETEDIYVEDVTEDYTPDPSQTDVYATPEPVPVSLDYEILASVLADAMATPEPTEEPESTPEPEAAPEPTPQIIILQQTPETAATPTPEPNIMMKPFDDYTVTEGLLLSIFVVLLVVLVGHYFGRGAF